MNLEDLFKYGVTPKDGEFAGDRFKVISVSESGVSVRKWGDPAGTPRMTFSEGSYKIWQEPKTLFEDSTTGLLDHPIWGQRLCYFTKLDLLQEPREDYVSYSFEFMQAQEDGTVPK